MFKPSLVLVALAPVLWCTACEVAAVAVAAVVVTEDFQRNALVATVPEDADLVWKSAKSSLAHMTEALIHVDNEVRAAKTTVDDAAVVVYVRTFDVGRTTIQITAMKYALYSQEIAEMVQRRIVRDLNK